MHAYLNMKRIQTCLLLSFQPLNKGTFSAIRFNFREQTWFRQLAEISKLNQPQNLLAVQEKYKTLKSYIFASVFALPDKNKIARNWQDSKCSVPWHGRYSRVSKKSSFLTPSTESLHIIHWKSGKPGGRHTNYSYQTQVSTFSKMNGIRPIFPRNNQEHFMPVNKIQTFKTKSTNFKTCIPTHHKLDNYLKTF